MELETKLARVLMRKIAAQLVRFRPGVQVGRKFEQHGERRSIEFELIQGGVRQREKNNE